MPRRKLVIKRRSELDPRYDDALVSRFINAIMKDGKKSLAETICYGAFDIIQERTSEDPLKLFKKAIQRVKPTLEVKSRRVGGSNYQIPIEVKAERQAALSMRWLLTSAKVRKEYGMKLKLAGELIDASNKTGNAVKKKEDVHKMAEANKAFAHYRW